MSRRNGWELPFHLLQVVAITIFSLLLVAFYAFLAPFLGKIIYEYVAMGVYSLLAFCVLILYVRSAAIDPSDPGILTEADKTSTYKSHNELELPGTASSAEEPKKGGLRYGEQGSSCCSKVGGFFCGFLVWEDCRKDEHLLLPQAGEEGLFCTLCNAEVRKLSKHCRSCNKCVDGFDHHCRWLNNCVGRKNYITFVCLMAVTLLWFIFECGVGIAVLVRCFADRKAMENQIPERLGDGFSRPPFATVVALCTALSFLAIVPLGELFFFHVILIRKGITTYEYVVAMRAQSEPSGPSADGGDQLSYPSSPTSSAVTAISGRSSIGKGVPYKGAWCTPPRIFMDHPDEIIPHLEPGRLPSTVDPDAMHASKKGKLPQQSVRISTWNLAKLNSKEAIKAGEKARASSSVLRPVSSKNHPHDGDHLSTSNASGRTSPMSLNQRFNLQNTRAQNQEDLESCVNSISNLSSPCSNLTPSPFNQNREHYNPVYQSSANQSPFSTRASERKETTATNDNLLPRIPTGRNLLGPNDITRPLVVWNQEAGRFVSASTRSAGSSQGLAGAELLHTGQSIFFGGPLGAGSMPSYYQQGRSQRGGQLPVFVPSDSQQNQFSSRLP